MPDPTDMRADDIAALIERLREDADYIESYDGFVGSPAMIARHQREAADAIRVLELSNDRLLAKCNAAQAMEAEAHRVASQKAEQYVAERRRAEALEAALRKYGMHGPNCYPPQIDNGKGELCLCGLSAALSPGAQT